MKVYKYNRHLLEYISLTIAFITLLVAIVMLGILSFVLFSSILNPAAIDKYSDFFILSLVIIILTAISLILIGVVNYQKYLKFENNTLQIIKLVGSRSFNLNNISKIYEFKCDFPLRFLSPSNEMIILVIFNQFPWLFFFLRSNYDHSGEIIITLKDLLYSKLSGLTT